MAQLAQLGVAGGLSDIVGSDKDTEEGDSEEDMEEDGEGDQRIMAMAFFFAQCCINLRGAWNGHMLAYTPLCYSHTHFPHTLGV